MNILILTIPFFSSLAIFFFGRFLGQKGTVFLSIVSIGITMCMGLLGLKGLIEENEEKELIIKEWINIGQLNINFNLQYDHYSIWMTFLITTITFIVISYSTWYMYNDPHKNRFLSLLLMFAVSMLLLVSSSNLLQFFVGWESVGIMSYLLINYWYNSINSNKSAIKAILYNKIGDIGLIIGMGLILLKISDLNISSLVFLTLDPDFLFTFLLFSLLIAAIAKSAQIFLHPWLGDAMAGPTPVSALLHAATMVTAGVFLLMRLDVIIRESPSIQKSIIIIGIITIIFGGISSINQYDIKKLIAFSTSSQLGYMFLSNGLLLPDLGFFHLITHGFFKALLFLTAGILIHNFNHEQDLRKLGSLISIFPISYLFFLVGSLSILSFPFLSGFFSKEAILEFSLSSQFPFFIYLFMVIGAMFTAIYSIKLLYNGYLRAPNYTKSNLGENKEIPLPLILVISLLIFGSIFAGYYFKEYFLKVIINQDIEYLPFYIKLLPLILSLIAIPFAFISLNPWKFHYLLTLFTRRFFFDSIFNYLFAIPTLFSGYSKTFKLIDRGIMEYIGPIGLYRLIYTIPSYFSKNPMDLVAERKDGRFFIFLILTFLSLILLVFFF